MSDMRMTFASYIGRCGQPLRGLVFGHPHSRIGLFRGTGYARHQDEGFHKRQLRSFHIAGTVTSDI